VIWTYAGPSIAADDTGRIYVTGSTAGSYSYLTRYTDQDVEIGKTYQAPIRFKECIGMSLTPGPMLYVTERGVGVTAKKGTTPPRVYQFWDSNEGFVEVWRLEDKEIQGLRDVAVSRDGKSMYVLEDADNLAYHANGRHLVPARDLQGKGRLFRYRLKYEHEAETTITIR